MSVQRGFRAGWFSRKTSLRCPEAKPSSAAILVAPYKLSPATQSSGHLPFLALRATVYFLAQQKDWQDLSLADRIGMGIRSPSGDLDRLLLGRCVRFHPRSQ